MARKKEIRDLNSLEKDDKIFFPREMILHYGKQRVEQMKRKFEHFIEPDERRDLAEILMKEGKTVCKLWTSPMYLSWETAYHGSDVPLKLLGLELNIATYTSKLRRQMQRDNKNRNYRNSSVSMSRNRSRNSYYNRFTQKLKNARNAVSSRLPNFTSYFRR